MLRTAFLFLLIGLVAALLGFTGIAGASFAVARLLTAIFLSIFILLLLGSFLVVRHN
jgi:uncharacterized membrane protein YtjA (UPF0391 family)